MLLVPRDGEACLWVRRSYERAADESLFPAIRPMRIVPGRRGEHGRHPGDRLPRDRAGADRAYGACRSTSRSGRCGPSTGWSSRPAAVKSPYRARPHGAGRRDPPPRARGPRARDPPRGDERGGADERALLPDDGRGPPRDRPVRHVRVRDCARADRLRRELRSIPTYLDSPGGNAGMGPAVPLFGSRTRRLARRRPRLHRYRVRLCRVPHGQDHDVRLRPAPAGRGRRGPRAVRGDSGHDRHAPETRGSPLGDLRDRSRPTWSPRSSRTSWATEGGACSSSVTGSASRSRRTRSSPGASTSRSRRGWRSPSSPRRGSAGVGMVGVENTFIVEHGGGRSITGHHPGLMPVG